MDEFFLGPDGPAENLTEPQSLMLTGGAAEGLQLLASGSVQQHANLRLFSAAGVSEVRLRRS